MRWFCFVVMAVFLSACQSPPRPAAQVVAPLTEIANGPLIQAELVNAEFLEVDTTHYSPNFSFSVRNGTINSQVTTPGKTNKDTSQFSKDLDVLVVKSGIFEMQNARKLFLIVQKLEAEKKLSFGEFLVGTVKAESKITYLLMTDDGVELLREEITATGEGNFEDSAVYAQRQNYAQRNAVLQNFDQFRRLLVDRASELNIQLSKLKN